MLILSRPLLRFTTDSGALRPVRLATFPPLRIATFPHLPVTVGRRGALPAKIGLPGPLVIPRLQLAFDALLFLAIAVGPGIIHPTLIALDLVSLVTGTIPVALQIRAYRKAAVVPP